MSGTTGTAVCVHYFIFFKDGYFVSMGCFLSFLKKKKDIFEPKLQRVLQTERAAALL